jgi:opacity protein-like surface antigen
MLKSIMSAAVVFGLLNVVPVNSETFEAKQGDVWLGGSFSFSSMGYSYDGEPSGDRMNMFMLSPITRFFPADYFSIGPKISWLGVFPSGGQNITMLGLGGELGYVYGGKILPYFFAGSQANLIREKYESYDYDEFGNSVDYSDTYTDWSYVLPLSLGVVVPVVDNLGLQFEFGFQLGFNEGGKSKSNQIFIGFGICGLGKNVAISALSSTGILNSLIGW